MDLSKLCVYVLSQGFLVLEKWSFFLLLFYLDVTKVIIPDSGRVFDIVSRVFNQ